MLLSAVSVLVVAQSSSEIPEGLMNNPVLCKHTCIIQGYLKCSIKMSLAERSFVYCPFSLSYRRPTG